MTTKTDTAVVKADHAVDKAADRLQEFANKAAAEGGLTAKIAPELFDVDDLGQAHEVGDGEVPPVLEEKARLAAANCPEFAIVVEE